jgi:hypothetical protein
MATLGLPITKAPLPREAEIDRVLLHIKGLVFVRALLEEQGASEAEIAEHTAELGRERERLAQLVRATAGSTGTANLSVNTEPPLSARAAVTVPPWASAT